MGVGKDVLVIFNERQKITNKEERVKDAGEESDKSNLRLTTSHRSYIKILIGIFSSSNVLIPKICL